MDGKIEGKGRERTRQGEKEDGRRGRRRQVGKREKMKGGGKGKQWKGREWTRERRGVGEGDERKEPKYRKRGRGGG